MMRLLGLTAAACLTGAALGQPATAPAPVGLVVGSGNYFSPIVRDLDAAIAFYRDGLGLEAQGTPGDAAANTALRDMFGLPDAQIRWATARTPAAPGGVEMVEIAGAGGRPLERNLQDPGANCLVVTVRDLDATLARLRALGAPVVSIGGKPLTIGQGTRIVVVQDPDGNFVELSQPAQLPSTAPPDANVVGVRLRLAVDDVEAAARFYQGQLGFQARAPIGDYGENKAVLHALGLNVGQYRVAQQNVPGSGLMYDFVDFRGTQRRKVQGRIQDFGSTRVQLRVRDLDAAIGAFMRFGGEVISTGGRALALPAGNSTLRVAIVRDPSNLFVVLIEEPPQVAGNTGLPQAQSAPANEQERLAEEIRAAVETEGPRSAALIDPLTELAVLYEVEGDHALAAAALEEARHVVRANYGLHTLEQAPLLQQALENQQALRNFATVQALEEELLDLANRHPDDLRTVAIHRGIGERRMNLLNRFIVEEYPAEIYGESGLFSFTRSDVIGQLVAEAQIHYADAAAVILRNGQYSSAELRNLELEIVRANDLFRQRARPATRSAMAAGPLSGLDFTSATSGNLRAPDKASAAYQNGRASYQRIIAYDEAAFGSSAEATALRTRLGAYVQLADWDLLFSENGIALDQYERVHELLAATDFGEPLIAEIFAPSVPIVLPTFLPNPLQTLPSSRYVDVSFEVTRFGESRRVEIVDAAPSVSDAVKDELLDLIRTSRFRPRVTDGQVGRASPVVFRYYFGD